MLDFAPGQRWINDAQLENGLGTVLKCDQRSVTILFMATGETFIYSRQSAPLTRVRFSEGDKILSHDDQAITVREVLEDDGLLIYRGVNEQGEPVDLLESLLNNFIQLNRPSERLFNKQIDAPKWFDLRLQTLQHMNRLAHSELRGLIGGRTSLIPHQLYIAHEVANRYAPRVLLADEVGLGKTIEAGMILHQQLLTERARRILIVVPESLVHQWLVEMLRRFNLMFHVFDEQRCMDILESGEAENPFMSEQLVLCSQEFLTHSALHFELCVESEWDLLVVDEAHHLQWSEDEISPEYAVIEELALQTKGVLLLTATPEQLGKQGHFARLRLLDPDRFPDFQQFVEEEQHYQPIAKAVNLLIEEAELDAEALDTLAAFITENDNRALLEVLQDASADEDTQYDARVQLVEHLLDRHGTGRVLLRNTRNAVEGFPERQVTGYPLALPVEYQGLEEPHLLTPELSNTQWTSFDPRLEWLANFLLKQSSKTLVITATAQSALEIAEYVRVQHALHVAVFHEGMSLIERDRGAAFFADMEDGAPALICSEIGSEGRNFQFAHHLVMFDLPENPDLLEQRIGRLDRIGQTETIQLHVPYLENSAQATLFRWYKEGLGAFEQTCPAGHTIYKSLGNELHHTLQTGENLDDLIVATQMMLDEQNAALQAGRDRLLEYNSCRHDIANELYDMAWDDDLNSPIEDYMESLFDCYGVHSEEHRYGSFIIRPTEHMLTQIPGLAEDGMTITYRRDYALSNEDVNFLSWDHPLVRDTMDLVATSEMGNAALTAIKHPQIPAGSLLLETSFILDSSSSRNLNSNRYLPPTNLHIIVDQNGNDVTQILETVDMASLEIAVDKKTASKIISLKEKDCRKLLKTSEALAESKLPVMLQEAHDQANAALDNEINRLIALQQVNPNIRNDEIDYYKAQKEAINAALDNAQLRLDSIRIIVAT